MNRKKSMNKYYTFILYLVAIILINLAGLTLFFRIDLTSNGLYSLSRASKEAVATLKEPLTVNVFFSKDLPAPYNNVERYLHDLLEEYEINSNKYLSYRFYDVSAKEGDISEDAEENRKLAQSYGIYPINVQKIAQDEAKVQRAYMGMVLIHGDVVEKIPAIPNTDGLEYKITTSIKKMNNKISALLKLSDKIKVRLVLSSSIFEIAPILNMQGIDTLKETIQDMVVKANAKNYNRLEFVFTDPTFEPGAMESLKNYQRFSLEWPAGKGPKGEEIKAGKAMIALGLEYGSRSLERELLKRDMKLTNQGLVEQFVVLPREELEMFINDNVDSLIDINDELGYLTSHDTVVLAPHLLPKFDMTAPKVESLQKLNTLLSSVYTFKAANLALNPIPDSFKTLMIAGPKQDFSDWELLQIDQFLMKGKSLAIFLDSFREIRQDNNAYSSFDQPVFLPLNTGLEKLLDHYGVRVKKSYIMDKSCYVNRGQDGSEMPIYFVPILKEKQINQDFSFTKNISEIVMVKNSPLEIDQEKIGRHKLKATQMLASSDKSWEMAGKINLLPYMIQPPTDEKEFAGRPLAYLVEGEFPSYFADKPLPEKPQKQEEEKPADETGPTGQVQKSAPAAPDTHIKEEKGIITRGKPGKIFIIGTSDILRDNLLDEEGVSPNAMFLLNILDYLSGKEDIANMRSKNQKFNPIGETKPFTRNLIKTFNIVGLPVLFILLGVFIWARRKAKKKMIQQMFKK